MKISQLFGAMAVLAVMTSPLSLSAQDKAEDPAVAKVNGETIYRSEILAAAAALPPEYQAQLQNIFPALVERVVDFRLISAAAEGAGLSDDEEVARRVAELKIDVMREIYLQRQIEKTVNDDAVRARYDTFLQENPPQQEVRARHILVEAEDEAKAIIEELNGGADFATLASERSTGPSKVKGGDLGYFTAEQMVPEFSKQAFSLGKGEHSSAPVQTQFGWHVIKVEDTRETAPPSFASMEAQLRDEMSRQTVTDILSGLRDSAEIEILDLPELPGAGTQ